MDHHEQNLTKLRPNLTKLGMTHARTLLDPPSELDLCEPSLLKSSEPSHPHMTKTINSKVIPSFVLDKTLIMP